MDAETMLDKNITMDDVNFTLNNICDGQISCVFSDYNADKLVFRIRIAEVIKKGKQRRLTSRTRFTFSKISRTNF
jgi:DNA-directed RNA polymerase II subunit RPB1